MVLSYNSTSTTALLHSLLAVAELHRHGLEAKALSHQGKALSALRLSLNKGLSAADACQHLAAGMLLGVYEVVSHGIGLRAHLANHGSSGIYEI
jgi:hypothetical protein